MSLSMLAPIGQAIGIGVPIVGCVALFKKEQSKVAMSLMLTNIGCLIINCMYLLLLWSETFEVAMTVLKVLYLGNSIFYFSFILFLATYLEVGSTKLRTILMGIWGGIEILLLGFLWNGDKYHFVFEKIKVQRLPILGVTSVQTIPGTLYMIRNSMICMLLTCGVIYTTIRIFQTKITEEKHNLGRLCGAQFVVVVAMILMLTCRWKYDVVPLCASFSIIAIILGVIRGEFFRVTDQARDWVIEHTENALIITDKYYGYLDANTYAKKIFPELKDMQKRKLISMDMQSLFMAVSDNFEIDGRRYRKEVEAIKQGEKIVGFSMLLMDVTQQCRLLSEIEEEKERAEQANQAKSAFMSNMSHEIRTPMNAIVGMTDILLREEMPDYQREYLNNIKSSGSALLTIINDILDFSKIESGKMDIIEDDYEPMSMFNDLSMIFLNRIGDKNVELLYDIDVELPQRLYGDAQRIRQVVINLMNNAIKFTEAGSVTLRVQAEILNEEDINLSFYVEDTGQGIKPEDIKKLFGSFQQVDTKKNRYKEGTGLGLAIAKQLVELMGGTIAVESEYEKGSTFYFTIPQKIRSTQKAACVKKQPTEDIVIAGRFDSELILRQYEALAEAYCLSGVTIERAMEKQIPIEVYFTDEPESLSAAERMQLDKWNTKICVLQNPMMQNLSNIKATLINKPLYSLNFCQVLNNESISTGNEEEVACFVAPKAKVLIVDDNEMNLKVAKGLLAPSKIQIETAENGKLALDKIQKSRYDMVFFDHMMPVMDGVEATQRVRQLEDVYYKNLPIIALSANATTEARELFKNSGFNDFVAKPIKLKELCKCIRTWLPQEYIEEAEHSETGNAASCEISLEGSAVVEDIPPMEGINIAEGIANSGSKDLFIQLLGDFYKLIDQKSTKIEKCLADGLIRDYTIEVHALKSTARMIGAMELSEKFYHLEQLGNAEEQKLLEIETPEVLSLYRSYKTVLESYGRNNKEKQSVSVEEMITTLQKLKDAVDCFDLDGADEAMKQIENYAFPDDCQSRIEDLSAYVADVAMEEIMSTADELIAKLQ